ncbi:hypothetical protein GCM10007859_04470 [Brevundimonas denitrificans]|uniref:Yip1 domain-containing protein n=1 Tax=Brevundimonas denitrificans TaxID=1443434 RepID=A0ABQ6BEQ9_9CAUL|nr:hypothetical protein [Brevundimonas denitrificans]GLS00441.1 hypothetical protein GCM10007859_04470 [Brevundimonas denitrificans]
MADAAIIPEKQGDWPYLIEQLGKRTVGPIKSFPFVVYVLIGIVLFGGLGIWAELLRLTVAQTPPAVTGAIPVPPALTGVITAILTFFPTLIGSTSLQLILSSANTSDKVMIAFAIMILFLFLTAAILLPFFAGSYPLEVLAAGIASSLAAIWVWWITNGSDSIFQTHHVAAPSGGDLNQALKGGFDDLKT